MDTIWVILKFILEFILGPFIGIPLIFYILKIVEWLINKLRIVGVILAFLFLGFIGYLCMLLFW